MSDDGSKTPSPKSENVPTSSKTNMAVDKKHSHSEIEKRRRDKMNEYINDLSTMIPLPPSVGKKPDKLTVLRFTVQHMKALQGSTEPVIETKHKPGFLSDDDVRNLIAEAAGGFLIVVECDRGQVLYATGSVEEMLNISQADMMGYNFYQLVHSKDVPVIKVQLATTTADSKEEKNDSKNGLLLREGMEKSENLCPGAKRSFICRMKKGAKMDDKKNMETTSSIRKTKANLQLMNENDSVLISYEGYLKSWPPKKDVASGSDQNSRSCLVAVGRVVEVDNEQTDYGVLGQICEFETRQRADATFVRVDHSFTKIFGYCSDEVVGKSAYSFIYKDDLKVVTEAHHKALNNKSNSRPEVIYRFRAKAGHYLPLKTVSAVFRNPFSKEIDLIVTRNVVISHMLPNTMSITSLQRAQNTISTVQELEMDENLRDLLRKVDNLETNETKFQRKRGFNSKAGESEKIESPSDIGVLLAEQAKKIGQQLKLKPQSAKYSNVASPGKESPQQTPEVTSHSARSMNNRRQFENADEINTTTLEQTLGDGILIEQLTGIQGAIDMMENTGVNDEDYSMSLLMSVLENEDLGNVFNDMPWNLM